MTNVVHLLHEGDDLIFDTVALVSIQPRTRFRPDDSDHTPVIIARQLED